MIWWYNSFVNGVKYFAVDHASVSKWYLNCPAQAKNVLTLKKMAGVSRKNGCCKQLRPSRVLKSETLVKDVITTFEEVFINRFSVNTDSSKLFVLSSGVPVADNVAISMLSIKKEGERLVKTFQSKRIYSKTIPFHAPIKRLMVILKTSLYWKINYLLYKPLSLFSYFSL